MATQTRRHTVISAVHVFLRRGDEVLLLRRFNTGYEDGNYSVIAGHIEPGEEVRQAAAREAMEEAGILLSQENMRVVGVMHRKSADERVDFFLAADAWDGHVRNMEPDKCDDLRWFHRRDLPENMIPYVKYALEQPRDEMWYAAFGWD